MRAWVLLALSLTPRQAAAVWNDDGIPPWIVPADGVTYCLAVNGKEADTPEARAAARTAVESAAASWSAVCSGWCSEVHECGEPPGVIDDTTLRDGVSWLFWVADWGSVPGLGSTSVIAATVVWLDDSTRHDTDVLFNDRDYVWLHGAPATQQEVDLESIAVHELGHSLGLGHWDSTTLTRQLCALQVPQPSVMCSGYRFDGLVRTPTADDVEGLCALYPADQVLACAGVDGGPAGDGAAADGGDQGTGDPGPGDGPGGDAPDGDGSGGDGDALIGDSLPGDPSPGAGDSRALGSEVAATGCECAHGAAGGWSAVLWLGILALSRRRRANGLEIPSGPGMLG